MANYMHCPTCGQQQISQDIRFCSRCGFPLSGVAELVANGGAMPERDAGPRKVSSLRRRGVKQGVFIFLLGFLVVPIMALFHLFTNTEPFLAAGSAILLGVGSLLRIAYALMFETDEPAPAKLKDMMIGGPQSFPGERRQQAGNLPAAHSVPANAYAAPATGRWRETNELAQPMSVTDTTTKLLAEEQKDQ